MAFNYNASANVEDSSCLYSADCIDGPGNPYWLNDECYAWVISVDDYCCDNQWDETCQEMYNIWDRDWETFIIQPIWITRSIYTIG